MDKIYKTIEKFLRSSAKKHNLLLVKSGLPNSQAKVKKEQIHIYGKKEVGIGNRPKQKTYVSGIIMQKNFVGFYCMGFYAFPKEFRLSPSLKKMLKGKSCFHVNNLDGEIGGEIREVIEKNIDIFKKKGWI